MWIRDERTHIIETTVAVLGMRLNIRGVVKNDISSYHVKAPSSNAYSIRESRMWFILFWDRKCKIKEAEQER